MRQDSRVAFGEFVRVHGDALTGLAYALGGDRSQAEDATQEALTRLYLRWARIEDPLPYARRCVVNACRDQARRSRRRLQRERLAARLQPPAALARVDAQVAERDRLLSALRQLPYGQRAVVVLRYWHQLSEPEVAAILGISVGTVKSQASRALSKLRYDLDADAVPTSRREQQ